jgi:predicted ATPase
MKISYRLTNFAAFADTGSIELAPITVLCGENSSGKSSILKSLLLLKQSSANRSTNLDAGPNVQPLLLNGEFTRLGSWTDLVHMKNRANKITFDWELSGEATAERSELGLYAPRYWSRRQDLGPFEYHISLTLASDKSKNLEYSTYVDNITIFDQISSLSISLTTSSMVPLYNITISNVSILFPDSPALYFRTSFNSELTNALLNDVRRLPPFKATTGDLWVDFLGPFPVHLFSLDLRLKSWVPFFSELSAKLEAASDRRKGEKPSYLSVLQEEIRVLVATPGIGQERRLRQESTTPLLDALLRTFTVNLDNAYSRGLSVLADFWGEIRYLGPLREQPRRFYQFDDTGSAEIGSAGQFSVQVLSLEENNNVTFSRIKHDEKGRLEVRSAHSTSLIDSLNYWLDEMGLPRVSPHIIQQSLYELNVSATEDLKVSLPDVGFGVSQVLPVILECLRANKGDTVILEQPEIHLHPRIQSILADFFIARAQDGIRFIVESHSEYFVKRLCRRVSEGKPENIAAIPNIIFVHREEGVSQCEKVVLNEFGEIENWPSGFFDLGEDASWVDAALSRRLGTAKNKL